MSEEPKPTRAAYIARIQDLTKQIPKGRVATYGQLSFLAGAASARIAGHAMARLPNRSDVPWHRVVNSQGKLAPRKEGGPSAEQARRLRAEGVFLDKLGRVDFKSVAWAGPPWQWLDAQGYDLEDLALRSQGIKRSGAWVNWGF